MSQIQFGFWSHKFSMKFSTIGSTSTFLKLLMQVLMHCIIILQNKIQFLTFSLTPFPHRNGNMLILKRNYEMIKLWLLCLAPTLLLYLSQFLKKKKLGFEPKPTHLFGQCLEICNYFFLMASLMNIFSPFFSATL